MQLSLALLLLAGIVAAQDGYNCPGGSLTPEQRRSFIDKHNELRSQLAKGLLKSSDGMPMPKAKNMMKLNYSCELEQSAQEWANRCVFAHDTNPDRDFGENLSMGYSGPAEEIPATISKSWWNELEQKYPNNPSNLFTEELFDTESGHFTQMAWALTSTLGCGIADCGNGGPYSDSLVVCRYRKPGNVLGGFTVYEIGEPCSGCPSNKCSDSEGLCVN